MVSLFVGVDGGATKSIIRVEDENGRLLGEATSGPANIRISVADAWQSIDLALAKILTQNNLLAKNFELHVGMGLAGCEVQDAYQAFVSYPHAFKTLVVTHDSHIACLAAHEGADGAVIIAGTGVVGYQIHDGKTTKVGGWGFPHDDEGGGAWLGLEAIKITVKCLDGRLPQSRLAQAVFAYFHHREEELLAWANSANSTKFAELARIVIAQAQEKDPTAMQMLKQAANCIDEIAETLYAGQIDKNSLLPCALVGSIASFLHPLLSDRLKARLISPRLSPESGAILLVRRSSKK